MTTARMVTLSDGNLICYQLNKSCPECEDYNLGKYYIEHFTSKHTIVSSRSGSCLGAIRS